MIERLIKFTIVLVTIMIIQNISFETKLTEIREDHVKSDKAMTELIEKQQDSIEKLTKQVNELEDKMDQLPQ